MLARRFLWIVAGLIVLALICAFLYRLYGHKLVEWATVPTVAFEEAAAAGGPDYASADSWIARPDRGSNPALWLPTGMERGPTGEAAVFFIHPTSYLEKARWNAPVDDAESQQRARLFVRSQASAFNGAGEIWAPKYRQATFGAFLTTKTDAQKALDLAYRDVARAFDAFVRSIPAERPIILAGHSQGSLHLIRLLKERVAGTPLTERIVAAYAVGWPISISADLERLGLPGCREAGQARCILSWQSFAEPADPQAVTDVYDASTGFDGTSRAGSPVLCVNPLTGAAGGAAPAAANLGTLVPNADLTEGTLTKGAVPARCDVRGFLLIGADSPDLGAYVLPGNNYHVYDYALFWANVRADAEARLRTFLGR